MPTSIDNKVVELKFDNRDFEKNTKQSMATLDKLKTSLDMTESERSFEKLSRSSDSLSFNKASSSVDTFSVKLSALSSVAISAIGRITNSLMDLGEQLVRNITGVDYISAGFSKYEDIIGYQQTMLSNAKNLSEAEMQSLLDKLVWFSDETSFSADAMMQAMSSYISSGATELEAQAAALGTALWAAMTGNSNASLMSANNALPKIFGKGYMLMQEWQSIVSAKMDAPWIRDLFIETAAELGKLEKRADGFYTTIGKKAVKVDAASFTGTFQSGWLDTNVLLKTFSKLTKFTDKVYDEYNNQAEDAYETTYQIIRRLGDGIDDVGYKALKMAQETKTWSETWGYVQGALTAGWSKTFETIFGSYRKSSEFFSNIVESLYEIFLTPSEKRNNFLKDWAEYTPTVASDLDDIAEDAETIEEKLKSVRDVVISIIRGTYGNGSVRVAALAEEFGADTGRELQQVVNQVWKQWDGKNWSLNYELLDELTAGKTISSKTAEAIKQAAESMETSSTVLNGRDDLLDGIASFLSTIARIKSDLSKNFSEAFKDIFGDYGPAKLYEFTHKIAENLRSFDEKTQNIGENTAWPIRTLVLDLSLLKQTLSNLFSPVKAFFGALGDAIKDVYADKNGGFLGAIMGRISGVVEFIKSLSDNFKVTKEQLSWPVQTLVQDFKMLLSIIDNLFEPVKSLTKIFGDAFKNVFGGDGKLLNSLAGGISNILVTIKGVTDKLKPTQEQLAKIQPIIEALLLPIKLVGQIITTIFNSMTGGVLSTATSGVKSITDRVINLASGFANLINDFGKWIEETGLIKKVISPAFEFVSKVFGDLWAAISKFFGLDVEKEFPSFEGLFDKWRNAVHWVKTNVIDKINETFGINLHLPTWESLTKGWENIKTFVANNIVAPFESVTGLKFRFPTWEDIKKAWSGFKDWMNKNVFEPIGSVFGKDFHFPNLDDVKAFFTKIGDFVKNLFKKDENIAEAAEAAKDQEKSWGTIGDIFKNIFELVGRIIKFIGDIIKQLGQNENFKVAFKTGIFAVIMEVIDRFGYMIYSFSSGKTKLNDVISSVSDALWGLESMLKAKRIESFAKSIGILALSLMLLAMIPTDQLHEATAVIIELVAAMALVMTMMNSFNKVGTSETLIDKTGVMIERPASSMANVGKQLIKMAASIMLLAVALKMVSKIGDPKALRQSLFAIEELLFAIAGVMVMMNKTAKVTGGKNKVSTANIQFFGIAVLITTLAIVMAKLATIEGFSTSSGAFQAIERLFTLIGALMVLTTKFSSGATGKSVHATGILLVTFSFILILISVISKIAKGFEDAETGKIDTSKVNTFVNIMDTVTRFVAGMSLAVAAIGIILSRKAPKENSAKKLLSMAGSFALIAVSLGAFLLTVAESFALIAFALSKSDPSTQAATFGLVIGSFLAVTVAIGFLIAYAQSSVDVRNGRVLVTFFNAISAMIAALSVFLLAIAISIRVLADSSGGWKNLIAAAVAVSIIIATMLAAVRIITKSIDKIAHYPSIDEVFQYYSHLGPIILLMAVLTKVIQKLVPSLLLLSVATQPEKVLSASLALSMVLTAISGSVFIIVQAAANMTRYDINSESLKKFAGLGIVLGALVAAVFVIATALSVLSNVVTDPNALWASVKAIGLLLGEVAGIFALFDFFDVGKDTNLAEIGKQMFLIASGLGIIALSLAAVTAVVSNEGIVGEHGIDNMKEVVKALAELMLAFALLAAIASIPPLTKGFEKVTELLIALGNAAAGFSIAIALIVAALLIFKDTVYDIADNQDRFINGVTAIFMAIAQAVEKSLPVLLSAIVSAVKQIVEVIIVMIFNLIVELNDKMDEIIKELLNGVIKALSILKDYIGPLVAMIFEFVVDVLEGLAFAINTRGGRLVAAIYDVIGSIITLIVKVLGELLSIALGWIPGVKDGLRKGIENVSASVTSWIGNAGTDLIEAENASVDKIVKQSPRLAQYYKKYGKSIESAIEGGTEGITTTLTDSGNGISSITDKLFNSSGSSKGLADRIGLTNLGSLTSYGNSAGLNIGDGLMSGLNSFSLLDTLPSMDDYSNYGANAAKSEQAGYTRALMEGIRSGTINNTEQLKQWQKKNNASNEFIDSIIEKIDSGYFKGKDFGKEMDRLYAEYEAGLDTSAEDLFKKYDEVLTTYVAGGTIDGKTINAIKANQNEFGDMGALKRDYSADAAISALLSLYARMNAFPDEPIPDYLADSLWDLREVLSKFGYTEYQDATKLIDYMFGISDYLPDVDPLKDYVNGVKGTLDETTKALQEADRIEREETEKSLRYKQARSAAALDSVKLAHAEENAQKEAYAALRKYSGHSRVLFYDLYLQDYAKLDQETRDLIKRISDERPSNPEEILRKSGLGDKEIDIYRALSTMWHNGKDWQAGREFRDSVMMDLYNQFVNSDASEEVSDIVVQMLEKVPSYIEKRSRNGGLDSYTDALYKSINWDAIIADPSQMSKGAWILLFEFMYSQGNETADYWLKGLMNGLENKTKSPQYTEAINKAATTIPKAFRNTLEIQSPSKVGEEIGDYFMQGVANGITSGSSLAGDESADAGVTMWQRLKDAINAAVGFNVDDLSPVIRPILDLDEIIAGSEEINGLVGGTYRRGVGLGIGPVGYGDLQAIAQLNKTGLAQAIQESVLSQPVNQTLNNTFNIQSNDPNEVARRVSAILSSQIERKSQVWGPARVTRATQ